MSQNFLPADAGYNNTVPRQKQPEGTFVALLIGIVVVGVFILLALLALRPGVKPITSAPAPAMETTPLMPAMTATALFAPTQQPPPSSTPLPAIDGITISYQATVTPFPAPTESFMAQSGGVASTPVFYVPTATPSYVVYPPVVTPLPPVWVPPVATPLPLPTPEMVAPLTMPPLIVTTPNCGFNPLYVGYDPRVGCRMPFGENLTNAELWVNGTQIPMTVMGWNQPSVPVIAQPGQIIIWSTSNNLQCVSWNPNVTLGPSDLVYVRLHTNIGRAIDGLIIIHQHRTTVNPYPSAHACGYSPDRTSLYVEVGDTLSRFMLALDIQPNDAMWLAWLSLHGTYQLNVGQVYAVPPLWTSGGVIGVK
jgi:hypothetical protein